MLEKHALPDQIIIKCLNTNYGIAVATLTFLPIGADTNASIYKAQTFDQTSYFIKLKLGHHHDKGKIFKCSCGHVENADVNASFVISLRHQGILQSPIDRDIGEGRLARPTRIVALKSQTSEPHRL